MTDEQKKDEQTIEEQDERKSPAVLAMRKQIKELRDQLDAIKANEETARKLADQKELEAKGNYEAILKQREQELAAIKAEHSRALLQRDVREALALAGIKNKTFIAGAVAGFDGDADGIADFVASIKADPDNAPLFSSEVKRGIPAAQTPGPAAASSVDWKQIQADLTGADVAKSREAARALEQYALAHGGELPPGLH